MSRDRSIHPSLHFTKRHLLFGSTALAMAAGVASVGYAAGNSREKSIVVGQIYDLTAFTPYASPNDFPVWKHLMEPLITFDFNTKKYVGVLASDWTVVDGDWIFKIREGVKFHDGSPLTAQDVKFSLERALKSNVGFILRPIDSVAVVDAKTVKIKTKVPFANLLARVKHIVILSATAHQRLGEDEFKKTAIGTGPYTYVEWKRGVRLVATKAPSYWGKPVDVEQIVWQAIPDQAARLTALEAGSADVIVSVPTQEVGRIGDKPGVRIESVANLASFHIALAQRFEPFRNKLVRQAINYAIDVNSIVKDVLDGQASPAVGVSGPSAIGYNAAIKQRVYDPEKAKRLLAEAGYPGGFSVDFYSSSGRDPAVPQTIVAQLGKVGIKVNLLLQEPSVYWEGMSTGKWPMVLFSAFNEEDPELFLSLYFETGITKRLEFSDPGLDDAVKKLRTAFDPVEQDKLSQEINAKIYEDLMPTVPLYHPQGLYGVNGKLDWKPAPNEEMYFHRAAFKS